MSTPEIDVRALAKLARMEVADEELATLEKELPAILSFVETVSSVKTNVSERNPLHRNVMREDENPHEGGIYTEKLLAQAPNRKGDRIAVKQVISRKK
jgi:aspartyl-tRNA(Asn)/glutamyl-tRNA(Gln) amidotransferase subunit C